MAGFWKEVGKAFVEGCKIGWCGDTDQDIQTTSTVNNKNNWREVRISHEKQKQEVREGFILRGRALADAGVDLHQFSEEKAKEDAHKYFIEIAPNWSSELGNYLYIATCTLNPENLTKSGKIPKNVVVAHVDGVSPLTNDGVIACIKYMADGNINMIDFHIWKTHVKNSVSMRLHDEQLKITSIDYYDMKRDFRKLLYSEKNPPDNTEAMKILDISLQNSK